LEEKKGGPPRDKGEKERPMIPNNVWCRKCGHSAGIKERPSTMAKKKRVEKKNEKVLLDGKQAGRGARLSDGGGKKELFDCRGRKENNVLTEGEEGTRPNRSMPSSTKEERRYEEGGKGTSPVLRKRRGNNYSRKTAVCPDPRTYSPRKKKGPSQRKYLQLTGKKKKEVFLRIEEG